LYSLGVTLWEMLMGKTPFRGTPGEVMHQHQHAPLPLDLLEAGSRAVVVLLEMLLEKTPPATLSKPNRSSEGDADDNRRYRRRVQNYSPGLSEDPVCRFSCRNSQTASKTSSKEDFRCQTARYRKRCFWTREGHRFSGSCIPTMNTASPIEPASNPKVERNTRAFLKGLNSAEGPPLEQLSPKEVRDRLVGLQASAPHDLPPWPMRVNSTQPAWRSRWCAMTA
jgi:serine/threonine protein kinase